jgi:hypothetical protein
MKPFHAVVQPGGFQQEGQALGRRGGARRGRASCFRLPGRGRAAGPRLSSHHILVRLGGVIPTPLLIARACMPHFRVCMRRTTTDSVPPAMTQAAGDLAMSCVIRTHRFSVMSGSGFWVSVFAWHPRLLPFALGTPSFIPPMVDPTV